MRWISQLLRVSVSLTWIIYFSLLCMKIDCCLIYPGQFIWVSMQNVSLLAAIDFIGLFTRKSNYPCRCIWWWGSSSQSIWSRCLEILGTWDSYQFSSETSFTSSGEEKEIHLQCTHFTFVFLLPLLKLVSYSQKTFWPFAVTLWVGSPYLQLRIFVTCFLIVNWPMLGEAM